MEINIQRLYVSNLNDIYDLKNYIPYFEYMEKSFYEFAKQFDFPISILHEDFYVDRTFRDSYYTYFASKHFTVPKNCQRISIFEGNVDLYDFYDINKHKTIQDSFIGTIVIRPLRAGTWGKTLIDPNKLHQKPFYVRTTQYNLIINGVQLKISAYPFSSQDTETMTCAETSIWTMLDYYGNRYPEYRTVMPSDIISEVNLSSDERVLPSHGLSYLQKSNLLKKFGFSPRVYERQKYGDVMTKKIFHYYVESGIPLTISLSGHSTVCIGHSAQMKDIASVSAENRINGIDFYDSADFYDDYVIIDDNQTPYVVETYDNFSIHPKSKKLLRFTVPLYKRIFLEASDAKGIFDTILKNILQIPSINSCFAKHSISKSNPVIKRLFLTSSRKFKAFRVVNTQNHYESDYYSKIPFPKFVWVLELSGYNSYKNEVFGEIVLDATAGRYSGFDSVILIRIDKFFAYRLSNESFDSLVTRLTYTLNINSTTKQYLNNLLPGGTT